MKQCNKEKNILKHRFVYACACDDVAFTTLNSFGVCINSCMLQTILQVFCVLFKICYRLLGHTPARILYPRHPCGSTFACFEILYKNNTSYQKLILFMQKRYW